MKYSDINILDIYKFNLNLALKKINKLEGLKKIIEGIEYFRCLEDPLVYNNLKLEKGLKLLDIGSSTTIFPLFVCSKEITVVATDIDDRVLNLKNDANILKLEDFRAEMQDARKLPYADNYFDRISAISTLEHIPNDGDSKAIKEMARVLKEEGILVITVPYGYFEDERQQYISYYQRVYNKEDILKKLIHPSGLEIVQIRFFGETNFNFMKYWQMTPSLFKPVFSWSQPIFSKLFLKIVDNIETLSSDEKIVFMRTAGVLLILKKTNEKHAN